MNGGKIYYILNYCICNDIIGIIQKYVLPRKLNNNTNLKRSLNIIYLIDLFNEDNPLSIYDKIELFDKKNEYNICNCVTDKYLNMTYHQISNRRYPVLGHRFHDLFHMKKYEDWCINITSNKSLFDYIVEIN